MPIWTTAAITEQPELTLESWSIFELPGGERHLVGRAIENSEGRVSSCVENFDIKTMRAMTSSGRVYNLRGRPGHNSDAEYTWNRWRAINDIRDFVNVSSELWNKHLSAKAC